MPAIEEVHEEPAPSGISPKEPTPQPLAINFHNRIAVRVGMLAAAISSLLISVPIPGLFSLLWLLIWLVAAGFGAVYLYQRRTGEFLSTRNGARMGWITGVFCFAIATIFFTISVIAISSKGGLAEFYREQFEHQAGAGVNIDQVLKILESPAGLATILLFTLILLFFLFTLLPTLGGVLGAKVLEKE
jgi:hypothetical protein